MFCRNCGAEISEEAFVCPKCGVRTGGGNGGKKEVAADDAPNMGFAFLGFLIPLIGLILWLMWKDTSPLKAKSCGKGALVGVIVSVVVSIIYGVVVGSVIGGMLY